MKSTTALLTHPDVLASLTGLLVKRGIRRDELEDAVAEVQLRALETVKDSDPPAEIPAWKALCNRIALRYLVDRHRRAKVRDQYEGDLCENPDAHSRLDPGELHDPIDARKQLEEIGHMIELGARTASDTPTPTPPPTPTPTPAPTPTPTPTLTPTLTPTQLTAATLRRNALAACGAHHWAECLAKLDDASALDPSGDLSLEGAGQHGQHSARGGDVHPRVAQGRLPGRLRRGRRGGRGEEDPRTGRRRREGRARQDRPRPVCAPQLSPRDLRQAGRIGTRHLRHQRAEGEAHEDRRDQGGGRRQGEGHPGSARDDGQGAEARRDGNGRRQGDRNGDQHAERAGREGRPRHEGARPVARAVTRLAAAARGAEGSHGAAVVAASR